MLTALITTASLSWRNLANLVVPIQIEYCNKHKYVHIQRTVPSEFEFHKIKAVIEVLDEGTDLVFCLDLDTLITNHNIKIESFLDAKHDFYITQDINEINVGAVIVKNTKWSNRLLEEIFLYGNAENEQNALKPFMSDPKVKILPHPSINSYPYDEYAPTYGLIPGRKPLLGIEGKPTHEQGNWEQGDFIMHLPGLPMERRLEIFRKTKNQIVW